MAHPDPKRQGNEKGQRQHAGRTSAASDAGLQSHTQGARGKVTASTGGKAAAQGNEGAARGGAAATQGRDRMVERGLEVSGGERLPDDSERDHRAAPRREDDAGEGQG